MFKNRFEVSAHFSYPSCILEYTEESKCCGFKEGGREGLSQARFESLLLSEAVDYYSNLKGRTKQSGMRGYVCLLQRRVIGCI